MSTELLTKHERADLAECEAIIERALVAFDEFGRALRDIREQRLYRQNFPTFEAYCQTRWSLKSSRARQLIGAAIASEDLAFLTTVAPTSERQLRPLIGLNSDERQDAWSYAVAGAEGQPTGDQVAAAASELAELRQAVQHAGGAWYNSRDGKHLVTLPDQPANKWYMTEELHTALGITTIVESGPTVPLLPPAAPESVTVVTHRTNDPTSTTDDRAEWERAALRKLAGAAVEKSIAASPAPPAPPPPPPPAPGTINMKRLLYDAFLECARSDPNYSVYFDPTQLVQDLGILKNCTVLCPQVYALIGYLESALKLSPSEVL